MIYSKSTQYAIRAITFLAARSSFTYCHLEMIAVAEQIPRHFLAKLMQRLARKRIVHSIKGVKGGFALIMPAETITLYMIADAIDDVALSLNECIFRDNECSDVHNCPLHDTWKKLRDEQLQFLHTISIADLVNARMQ
ncbi:Rrf2 family transcriptional regulator [bacterium]|nr:Rrf2 family transcriptional regulator [bacterium]